MGNLEKDIELDTIMPIYKTVKREVDGEIKEERIIIEQVDIEGFRVQGDRNPLSEDLLCVGHSSVREEKELWKVYYEHENPKDYREFWFCYDKLSNKVLIKMQKHNAPMYFVALFAFILCPIIGKAVATFILGIFGLGIIISLLTHRTKIVDAIFIYRDELVEVLKPQELLRFELLKNIKTVQETTEPIYRGTTLIAEDVKVYYCIYTEEGNFLVKENERIHTELASLDETLRSVLRRFRVGRKVLEKKEEKIEIEETE